MSRYHKILENDDVISAGSLINGETIVKIKSNYRRLYNILLEEGYGEMTVHGMRVETLHPDNKVLQ